MLIHLSLRDFAVAAAVELEFGPGLTVISGETGAGKSLLVDALGFLCGQRADAGMVRHGAARAELAAQFALDAAHPAAAWLREQALDEGDACQLRRVLHADGGSRAWLNGRPVALSQLAELAALLVEIHGQHEHQALLSRAAQLELLDAHGRNTPLRAAVAAAAGRWQALLGERERLQAQGDVADRVGYLEHQQAELAREALDAAGVATLLADHRRQAHAAELLEGCDAALARIGGGDREDGDGAAAQLQRARDALARVVAHEPRLSEVDAMLDAARISLDEAQRGLQRIRDDLDAPGDFDALDRRLARLHDLARKHRVPAEQLAEVQQRIADELAQLHGAEARLAELDDDIAGAAHDWREAAARLTAARTQAAAALSASTTALMRELGMGAGVFRIALEPGDAGRPDALGAERAEFLVSANAGQPPRPLRKVASGGELSRISLAIEVAALGADAVPTMVFDEVDAGIGGAVADIVGRKLRALAAGRQVLCVTHLPQVAAQGHAHYRVHKASGAGVTQSGVEALDVPRRVEELARMLGGVEIGREARAAARKLLSGADA